MTRKPKKTVALNHLKADDGYDKKKLHIIDVYCKIQGHSRGKLIAKLLDAFLQENAKYFANIFKL